MNGVNNDDPPGARRAGSAPTRETVVLESAQLYLEGTAAAAIMTTLGVISGITTLALSGDLHLAPLVAAVAFMLSGIVLTVRLWRMTRAPAPPAEPLG